MFIIVQIGCTIMFYICTVNGKEPLLAVLYARE